MTNLANCPRCGNLFVKSVKSVCDSCSKEYDKMFEIVYQYIRRKENRKATIDEVVEATGVEEDIIVQFIREGRLRTNGLPNLEYPCQSCGTPIKQGRLCCNCQKKIKTGLKIMDTEKELERKKKERMKTQTYTTLDDRLEKD